MIPLLETKVPTVPSTLQEEFQYNPFLRVDQQVIADFVQAPISQPVEVMRLLRKSKDEWGFPTGKTLQRSKV